MRQRRVGILIFPDVEVLDFCGPFEVFSVTRLDESTRRESVSPFEVVVVAESREPATATGGLRVLPDYDLTDCPPLDILVVPGGWGTRKGMDNDRLVAWVADRAHQADTVASVCTGSLLLGKAGVLDGKRATTHWWALDLLRGTFPRITVLDDQHVVEDGRILTSAGISAGIDLALKVVERYYGPGVARATAKYMEYPFPESNARRIAIA